MSVIGRKIKELREKREWSQRELAKRIGMSASVLNRIELGDRPTKDEEIKAFANIFDVSTDYLLGETDIQSPKTVNIAGKEVSLTPEEFNVFEVLKKHPILFHDLATDPEKKVKELIKLSKMKKMFLDDEDDEELGDGFGEIED